MPSKIIEYYLQNDDFSDPESLYRYYKKAFESKAKHALDYFGHPIPGLDMDPKRIRRRLDASYRNVAAAKEMINDAFHEYPGAVSFEKEWADLNSDITTAYDAVNNRTSLIQAAALWICDTLRKDGRLWKCEKEILPEVSEDDLFDMPHSFLATDMNYDNEIINKVIHVIIHRNDDCRVYQSKGDIERYLIDEATVRNKQFQDVPSRRRFENLLECIGKETIEEAVNAFREKYWQLARIVFDSMDKLNSRLYAQYRKHDAIASEVNSMKKDSSEAELLETIIKKMLQHKGYIDPIDLKLRPQMEEFFAKTVDIANIRSTIDDIQERRKAVYDCLFEYITTNDKDRESLYPKKLIEQMKDFRIEDPYRLSFALLYLCDRGDDLIWMYYFGTVLTEMIKDTLPWRYDFDFDSIDLVHEAQENKEGSFFDALYELKYTDAEETEEDEVATLFSAAQLMYQYTGCVAPRNMSSFNFMKDIFESSGVDEHTAEIAMTAMNFMYAADTRYESYPEEKEETDEKPVEGESAEKQLEELKKELSVLRKENRMLRELSHKEQKKAKQLEEKLTAQSESANADSYELARLRELAFSLQSIDDTAEDSSIRFPYENQKRIVVCGGHDTFIKQMKTLLIGDVRYLNNVRINEDIIRGTDHVWLQTNAISHSEYYKVVSLCRKNNIPFNYFLYASARKCAEQIYIQEHSEEQSKR